MAATQIAKPFHCPGWVYEEKVNGRRVLAHKDAAGVRLVSRIAKDLTRRLPQLAAAVAALRPPTLLLNGEIAVFDSQFISRFEWIRVQPKDEPVTPPTLNVLEELVDGQRRVLPVRRLAVGQAWAQVVEEHPVRSNYST